MGEIKHAVLPREHQNLTVGGMLEGESWYAPLSALRYDDRGYAWLAASAGVGPWGKEPNGRRDMIGVVRTQAGYVVVLLPGQRADFVDLETEDPNAYVRVADVHVTDDADRLGRPEVA
ncbi:hypothetical protein IU451_28715 [Nocardia cyriacigeorgica]|uniref:hypothetical protein n=1 Tax=Nocardia cyriacigeorgica TaxID=135487 RepID=UPI001894A344|nr:hypothetical protein [Nocardia cyriacigeorgica]MBF6326485.1 hypothetical protein [Nocardia cyriacigeorgica]